MLSSLQSTEPFSVEPKVIAFLWIVTNCRLSLCSSDNVTVRAGNVIWGRIVAETGRTTDPPAPCVISCWDIMADTMLADVCSNVLSASLGAAATLLIKYFKRDYISCRISSWVRWIHWDTHRGRPCVRSLHRSFCNSEPYLLSRNVFVRPRNCYQRRIPSDHRWWFFITHD